MLIPSMLLKKLYTLGSLKNAEPGVQFAVKNRLSDAELTGLKSIAIDGKPIALSEVTLELADGQNPEARSDLGGHPDRFSPARDGAAAHAPRAAAAGPARDRDRL